MMRKSKKLWLAAATGAAVALAAMALLVGAASGTTSVWLHKGEPVKEHVELSLTGEDVIEVGTSVLLCNSGATMATNGGSTAEITAYTVEKASCVGLEGKFKGCTVTSATAKGLPWSVSVATAELIAKEVGVAYSLDEGCPIASIETSFPEVTLFPEEPSAIRFFHFSETGSGKVNGEKATLTDGDVLELPEAKYGTYGIG
jgi:hypothetical protein